MDSHSDPVPRRSIDRAGAVQVALSTFVGAIIVRAVSRLVGFAPDETWGHTIFFAAVLALALAVVHILLERRSSRRRPTR